MGAYLDSNKSSTTPLLKDVYYTSKLDIELLSVSYLYDEETTCSFSRRTVKMYDRRDRENLKGVAQKRKCVNLFVVPVKKYIFLYKLGYIKVYECSSENSDKTESYKTVAL